MKVAFVLYTNGKVSGGAAKHARTIPPLMRQDPRVEDLRMFVPEGALSANVHGVKMFQWKPGGGRTAAKALKAELVQYQPDVVFVPSARFVGLPGVPSVVMVRNMEPLLTPFASDDLIDKLKGIARRFVALRACRKAARIIAVSEHVRDFLVDQWSLPEADIGIVYHGVEDPPHRIRPSSLSLDTDRPFLFSMGSIRPARGLDDLIGAMADDRVPADLQLLFAGKPDAGSEHYFSALKASAVRLGIADRVHWLGQCGPGELSWCFRNARIFVMTSRVEACPNTVLEAMRQGSFAISGDNAPMPEFFRDTALYYRNGSPASLAETIVAALALEPGAEKRMREAALNRSHDFTWLNCSRRTVDELEVAISCRNR